MLRAGRDKQLTACGSSTKRGEKYNRWSPEARPRSLGASSTFAIRVSNHFLHIQVHVYDNRNKKRVYQVER